MSRPVATSGRLVAGRYRLQAQIGGGGMGTVWTARDERLGRIVAVKQVLPSADANEEEAEAQRQRALREGRIAARLSNPHAISVYDVAVESGQPWLVMEYLPSRSLAAVLEQDGMLRVDQVAQIGAQVADALAATHAAGIVHRDVKPANILIGQGERVEGLVKITDFGISHASGDVTLTRTGQITGTPAYLSPEVAQGQEPGPASDVFSLGATLYTCLEGEPPFGMGENTLQQLYRVAAGEINPPQRSGALTRTLLRMLEADPTERPSMAQVRDDLARLAAGRDGDTTTVLLARTDLRKGPRGTQVDLPTPPPRTAEPAQAPVVAAVEPGGRRRRRALVPLLLGAALVVVAAVVLTLVLVNQGGGGNGTSASGPSATTTSTGSSAATTTSSQTSESSSAASSSAAPNSSANPAVAGTPTAAEVRNFISGYYAMLPGNAAQAYDLTGPTLRSRENRSNYIAFWNRFSSVRLGPVTASDGSLVAHGSVTYVENGQQEPEQHTFTLVKGQDGQLLMDSDVQG